MTGSDVNLFRTFPRLPKPFLKKILLDRPRNGCCQGTAAATEANPGAFGGLFGCSQHTQSKPGRTSIFLVKKMGIWGSTVVAVEILLPEHCCSYGSKPGWFWGPFWLFLTVENQAGAKKIFRKKWAYGGPRLCKSRYRCQSTAAAIEASPGGFRGFFGCSCRWENQAGPKKIFFVQKGHTGIHGCGS